MSTISHSGSENTFTQIGQPASVGSSTSEAASWEPYINANHNPIALGTNREKDYGRWLDLGDNGFYFGSGDQYSGQSTGSALAANSIAALNSTRAAGSFASLDSTLTAGSIEPLDSTFTTGSTAALESTLAAGLIAPMDRTRASQITSVDSRLTRGSMEPIDWLSATGSIAPLRLDSTVSALSIAPMDWTRATNSIAPLDSTNSAGPMTPLDWTRDTGSIAPRDLDSTLTASSIAPIDLTRRPMSTVPQDSVRGSIARSGSDVPEDGGDPNSAGDVNVQPTDSMENTWTPDQYATKISDKFDFTEKDYDKALWQAAREGKSVVLVVGSEGLPGTQHMMEQGLEQTKRSSGKDSIFVYVDMKNVKEDTALGDWVRQVEQVGQGKPLMLSVNMAPDPETGVPTPRQPREHEYSWDGSESGGKDVAEAAHNAHDDMQLCKGQYPEQALEAKSNPLIPLAEKNKAVSRKEFIRAGANNPAFFDDPIFLQELQNSGMSPDAIKGYIEGLKAASDALRQDELP